MGNIGMAQAALRNYFLKYVISIAGPEFRAEVIHPDVYAEHFWDRYAKRDKPEVLVGNVNS